MGGVEAGIVGELNETIQEKVSRRRGTAAEEWMEDPEAAEVQEGKTLMPRKPWKPHLHSNEATRQAPKFLAGDPIVSVDDGTSGVVEFSRHDQMICVQWASGRREWVHESTITWPATFQPMRRRA